MDIGGGLKEPGFLSFIVTLLELAVGERSVLCRQPPAVPSQSPPVFSCAGKL